MDDKEIKAYLNYEDVQKELEEAKEIIKELKLALITRDGNLTNKLIHEELTRLRSELQQKDEILEGLLPLADNMINVLGLYARDYYKDLIGRAKEMLKSKAK